MVQKKNIIILLYFAPKSKPKGQILPKEPLKICVNIQRKAGYIYIYIIARSSRIHDAVTKRIKHHLLWISYIYMQFRRRPKSNFIYICGFRKKMKRSIFILRKCPEPEKIYIHSSENHNIYTHDAFPESKHQQALIPM